MCLWLLFPENLDLPVYQNVSTKEGHVTTINHCMTVRVITNELNNGQEGVEPSRLSLSLTSSPIDLQPGG